jgi:hypothetical protein
VSGSCECPGNSGRCSGDLAAVNNLPSGQALSVAVAGIAVVYGGNGADKSGYARLLKHAGGACHTEVASPGIA